MAKRVWALACVGLVMGGVGCDDRPLALVEGPRVGPSVDADTSTPTTTPDLANADGPSDREPTEPTQPTSPHGFLPDACGNGVVDPGEACDDGLLTGFAAIFIEQLGHAPQPLTPVRGVLPAITYYGYENGSSHIGNEVVGESRITLYHSRDTKRLSVIVSHGAVDPASKGNVLMDFDFSFLGTVTLCDGQSATETMCELYAGNSLLRAHWSFAGESDGMILEGGAPYMNVLVKPVFAGGTSRWVAVDGSQTKITLDAGSAMTIRTEPSTTCRLDCQLP